MANRKELNPNASPQAAFGWRIRISREARGWRQEDLAVRMKFSAPQISTVETGRKMATLRFARRADVAFGFAGTPESFERQYHEMKHGVLMEGFEDYLKQEARAAEVRLFEVGLIPGVLQTEEYARVLAESAVQRGEVTPEKAAERVEFLIKRQAALVRTMPPMLIAVLDESCIRRPVGESGVMDRQLAHLVEFAQRPNTVLHMAPYAIGERRPFDRSVNLLTMSDRSVLSCVESQTQGHLDREITTVVPLVRAYHQLQAEALSQADSVDTIDQVRKGVL